MKVSGSFAVIQKSATLAVSGYFSHLLRILLLLSIGYSAASGGTFSVFSEQFVRLTGAPVIVSRTFAVLDPSAIYALRIENSHVSSAIIRINSVEVAGQKDFNYNVTLLTRAASLEKSNQLTVELMGQPDESFTINIIGIDNTPPLITAAVAPAPNAAGWNNTNVIVTFSCSDVTSGIAFCPGPIAVSTEGAAQVISGTARDNAGNTASTSVTLAIDKTLPNIIPSIVPQPNAAGWVSSNATINFTCSDTLSGIASCSSPLQISTEGANQTFFGSALDKAGNSAKATVTVSLDKTPPTITATATPAPNTAGWNNSAVTITFSCADALSGVESCPSPITVSADGANQIISGTVRDKAGNINSASVTVNIDRSIPTITAAAVPQPNAAGWNKSAVTVTFTCSDALSGVGTCPEPVIVSTEGAGQVISGTVLDRAGNTASTSSEIKVDKTRPVISIASPLNGSTVTASALTISGAASDFLSGLSFVKCNAASATLSQTGAFSCALTLNSGANVISITAEDVAGNVSTSTLNVTFQPNQPPTVSAGASQTVFLGARSGTGKIVVNNDEWQTTNVGFAQTPASAQRFVLNVAQWFKGAPAGGNFLAISTNFSLDPHQATSLRSALIAAGHSYVTSADIPGFTFSVANLLAYDGVFLACAPVLDQAVLIAYVKAGGNVYISGGTGGCGAGDAPSEAFSWNTFLNAYGLSFASSYNGVGGVIPIANSLAHPIFVGVTSLYQNNGNNIVYFGSKPGAKIIESFSGNGLFAVYQEPASTGSAATATLTGTLSDDGLPTGQQLSAEWSQMSGPGAVSFDAPTFSAPDIAGRVYSAATTATFPLPGVYVLRLTANDSQLTNSSDVMITVNEAPVITSVTPNEGRQSQTLRATIIGQNTHFVQGITTATFGVGITVASLTVNSATASTAVLTIDPGASLGGRTVSLTTNAEIVTLPGGFAVTAAQQQTEFLYSANGSSNNVSAFQINPSNGTLLPVVGSPFAAGNTPHGISVDPSNRFVYVTNANGNNISAYALDGSTGALLPVAGTPFAAGVSPHGIASDPTGRFVYAANYLSNNLSAYSINQQAGGLSAIGGAPFSTGAYPNFNVAVYPSGRFLYVPNSGQNPTNFVNIPGSVSGFSIDQVTGVLSTIPGSPYATAAGTDWVAIDPLGRFAYVGAGWSATTIDAFRIDSSTGAWSSLAGSPFTTGRGTRALAIDPMGKFLFVANDSANTVSVYGINQSTGALSAAAGSPYPSGPSPGSLIIDPSGSFLYVGNSGSNTISGFQINQNTGGLTPIAGSPFLSGQQPLFFATATLPPVNVPTLASILPAAGYQGQTLTLTIIGKSTHFAQSSTVLNLGAGITVASLTVNGPTTATAVINIDPTASLGSRTVTVTTGSEVASLANGFAVTAAPSPALIAVNPNAARQGDQSLPVSITGQFTNFIQGTTLASFGPGVSVGGAPAGDFGPVTVLNSSSATAQLNVGCAALGTRSLTARTGLQDLSLTNGFSIMAPNGPTWLPVLPNGTSPTYGGLGAGYDPQADRMILFGGYQSPTVGQSNDTWVLVNATCKQGVPNWIQLAPTGSLPAIRYFHSTAYDAANNRLIVFGGSTYGGPDGGYHNDVWVLTNANGLGGTPTWNKLAPSGDLPSPRHHVTAAFDNATNRLIVFGGLTVPSVDTPVNDVWVLTNANGMGGASAWIQLSPSGTRPSPRGGYSMGYDAANNRLTIFGGATSPAFVPVVTTNDSWILTNANGIGGTPRWIQLFGGNPAGFPSGRWYTGGSYNSTLNRLILVGGLANCSDWASCSTKESDFADDVWVLDRANGLGGSSTWAKLIPTGGPPSRPGLTAYDSVSDRITKYGSDTWVLANASQIAAGFPTIQNTGTSAAAPGQTAVSINITGVNTDFTQGSTQVTLGSGIAVNQVTVASSTSLQALVSIDSTASFGLRTIEVHTGSEAISLSDAFTVQPATAALLSITPNSAQQGQVVALNIVGFLTNFAQGTTQVNLGSGVTVNSVNVSSPTSLTAQVAIDASAIAGTRTIVVTTGAEVVSLANGFTINVSSGPAVTSVSPTSGQQGQSGPIAIAGANTHFLQGTTQVDFGPGVTISSINVTCPTCLTAQAAIAPDAAVGPRTVKVTTGTEVVSIANGFTVQSGTAILTSIVPNNGRQGQTVTTAVTGLYTHWVQGTTQLSAGPGVAVNSITVSSPTTLTAQLTIASNAATGARDFIVTTGTEVATAANAWVVNAGTPTLVSANPVSGIAGQTLAVTITGQFSNFVQGTTQVNFGAGIATNSVTIQSPITAVAQITISASAAPGARTITVTTGAESLSLVNGFSVTGSTTPIVSLAPVSGRQAQTLAVSIAGQNTNFVQGTTQAAFGAGISVGGAAPGALGPVTVTGPTSATASIAVDPAASLGARTVNVQTGVEQVSFVNGFLVEAGAPSILSLGPSAVGLGQSASISITGQFTHFVQGTTQVSFGAGVTTGSVTVSSATTLTAQISIATNASVGPRDLTITTGSEIASAPGAFNVQAGAATLTSINPTSGQRGQTLAVTFTGQFTNFVQGTTQVSFGGGISVNSVTVNSPTSATAQILIASNALLGARSVTATTGSEQATLANSFTVNQATNQAPVITIAPTWSVTLPSRLTLSYSVTDDGLPAGGALTTTWDKISGPGTVGFQDQTPTSISAGFSQSGTYVLRVGASDTLLTSSQDVTITVSGTATPPPTVSIATPVEGQEITTLFQVTGSVQSAALASWALEYRMAEESVFRPFATGTTTVSNASLGTFDPTVLLNGQALIRLRATDSAGQTVMTDPVTVVLSKNQKIGNFTVSFNDLTVPMAGLPLQVVRTYDSRNKNPGDFGAGWTLDLKSVKLTENIIAGVNWNATTTGGAFPNYCVQPAKAHVVTVTLPDGTNYIFDTILSPQCQQFVPPDQVAIGFTPRAGTNASLAVLGNNLALVSASFPGTADLFDVNTAQSFDANQYRLSLPDGRVLDIDQAAGLQKITDTNGNSVTISAGGFAHSSGKSVVFQRDGLNRITRITDPAGNAMNYAYNISGDLVSFTDREANTTTYGYDAAHGLLNINDPRGIQPIRNVYDAGGRLIQNIDAFGNVINYTHNIGTRQEIVTDRLGNQTVNEYDGDGNVVKVTDALGGVTSRTYDPRGNTLTETNALGKTRTYTYDSQDNRLTEIDAAGNTTTYTYNSRRQVLTITDPLGRVTANTYDGNGNLTATRDAAGQITSYTYDAQGLQKSVTDALGNVTNSDYDGSGNLTKQTNALGGVTSYTYDPNGNRLTETKTRTTAAGLETLITSYLYDKLNQLVKTTYADGSTTQIAYNSIGKQSRTTDQLGRQTSYQYDAMGRLTQTTFPDLISETSIYDAEGRRTSSTDRGNRTTTFEYDKLGRLKKTTFPDTATTTTVYDAAGQVTQVSDPRGNITSYAYDPAGRRTTVTNSLTEITNFQYNKAGNQVSMTDGKGNTTQYEYDQLNRRTRTIYADTTFDTVVYDVVGRTTSKTDQAGKTTQFQYDRLGRLTQVIDALSQVTRYTYDEVGNRLSQTDANNHTTTFAYDKLGRRTTRTLPLGMFETSVYNAAGGVTFKTDFNGKTTAYLYDSLNRLISKTPDASLSEPIVRFTYTATGQRESMVDATGMTSYIYDLRDRLTSKATPQGTLSYTYDLAGNLLTLHSSNAGGSSVDYAYDALNRLARVTDNRLAPNGVTTYNYDAAGNLANYLYPNGVQHTYIYNSLNRLTNLTVAKGATLASYAYTLGPSGNRTAVTEFGGRTVNYTYDALYRLTAETIAGSTVNGTIGYLYDFVGNRLQRTSTVAPVPATIASYDANDRLATDTYDSNGNTTGSAGNTYLYDFENHLKSLNAGTVAILYDGDGNRVSKTAGGSTTRYLVDDRNLTGYAQVVEELAGGAVQRVYTYGLNRISQSQSSGTSFYGYDGHGNVRILTDATGAVTDRYDYDGFGLALSTIGSSPNSYFYSGEQLDPSLGFYYLRARYLNPVSGRFISMDPFCGKCSDPRSLHKYLYADADPVNRYDPSGLLTVMEVSITLSIQSILRTYETKLLLPVFFQSFQIAECAIAPATQMRAIALRALSNGAGSWAQELESQSRAQIAQGYRLIGSSIAQGYSNFFSSLVTGTFSVSGNLSFPFLKTVREEVFSEFPGLATAAAAHEIVNRGTTYINKIAELIGGVAEAIGHWSANPRSGCGQAMLFNALGSEIIQHTPDFGGTSVTENYTYTLDGMTDDQYRQYVRGIVQQIRQ